eukprot:8014517-Ditylum_brightwellii.AAC.1
MLLESPASEVFNTILRKKQKACLLVVWLGSFQPCTKQELCALGRQLNWEEFQVLITVPAADQSCVAPPCVHSMTYVMIYAASFLMSCCAE